MSPQLHRRVREVFDLALERPETERIAFVRSVCSGEPDVLDAVTRLLDAHRGAQSFLQESAPRPQRVGRYLIVGELGRGTMGIVYEAVDPLIGRKIALKVIHLEALTDVAGGQASPERLFREAHSAGALLHPGIVVAFDVGEEGSAAFFAMEKVDGPSLAQVLSSGRKIEPAEALDLVYQTALALDYAHKQGVVHRDIKPANILLANGTTVKVADFSIAKILSAESLTATGMVWGTPAYMSPEQIEGRPLDGRADQFSLAVLAYELLTGAKPFQADSLVALAHVIVYAPRPSARAANPILPPAVDQVFYRALARLPKDRFCDCEEFAAALQEAAGPLAARGALAAPLDQIPAETPWSGRRLRYIVAAAAILPGLLLGIFRYEFLASQRKRAGAQVAPAPAAATSDVAPAAAKPTPTVSGKGASRPKEKVVASLAPADAGARVAHAQTNESAASETTPVAARPSPTASGKSLSQQKETPPVSSPPVNLAAQAHQLYDEGEERHDDGLIRRAAEMGEPRAMVWMGVQSEDKEAKQEAIEWFRKAADAGDANGMLHLGAMYQLGSGVPQDDQTAAYWYQKASDAGNASATFDLGEMYESGAGVPRDMNKATLLYRLAAENGNSEARAALARLKVN